MRISDVGFGEPVASGCFLNPTSEIRIPKSRLVTHLPLPDPYMGISLCMIVKNEQDWIAGAVESVRSIVNEVIIVDTGSTDQTPDRIRDLGVNPLKMQWTDSFAAARNASLENAKEPWILVLDADERIAPRDLPLIKEAIKNESAAGYHLIQRNYVFGNQVFGWAANTGTYDEGEPYAGYVDNPLIRLFRNSPELRFHGAVHEIVDPNRLSKDFKFGSIPAVIHHYGKVRERDHVAFKQRFYLALGLKKIKEDPANGKAYFDLGIQYQELGRHEEACACFDQTFEMMKLPVALLYWAISEKHLRQYESAASLLNRALKAGLNTFDVHLELGNVHLAQGQLVQARNEYAACVKMNPTNPIASFNNGLALRKMGDLTGATKYYERALELDSQFSEPALELAGIYAEGQRYDKAIHLLKPVLERNPGSREARLSLAKTYIQANRPDQALEALNGSSAEDAVALCLSGAAHFQKENLDEAQRLLETALRRDRSLVDARINLAQIYARKGDHARAARYIQTAKAPALT
jgi:O-antigen biosynthesis protein